MYVVTFYSYKGGVGRTMALANVATELARTGKRVLVVDFDLEAPSLPNYGFLGSGATQRGIVDYIASYRERGIAPVAAEYIYKCVHNGICLWIMPSGDTSTSSYTNKLASINWNSLYREEKGYLFFEDLKQQWKAHDDIGFDYVLIDSRTGHTDVGGICTRQLPDLVVAMFVPTMQNIIGLKPIINEIRSEKSRLEQPIDILFCASNVPNLDDEQRILSDLLDCAADRLSYDKESLKIVHHYASLDVLSHAIFSIDRPNTRLAREYSELSEAIIAHNYSDPDGAALALKKMQNEVRVASQRRKSVQREAVEHHVDKIFALHPNSGEIARLVARLRSSIGDIEGEIEALTAAIRSGDESTTLRGLRARAYQSMNLKDQSAADLNYIIDHEGSSGVEIRAALQMLQRTEAGIEGSLINLLNRGDISLSVLNSLAEFAQRDHRYLSQFTDRLFAAINQKEGLSPEADFSRTHLSLALIGCGRFQDAIDFLTRGNQSEPDGLVDQFNLFIARWGAKGLPDLRFATEIRTRMAARADRFNPNYFQCNAVLAAVTGHRSDALVELGKAREVAELQKGRTFSCVTYLYRTSAEFLSDCECIERDLHQRHSVTLYLGGLELHAELSAPSS